MTMQEYLADREGRTWHEADTQFVIQHLAEVECTWKQITELVRDESLTKSQALAGGTK